MHRPRRIWIRATHTSGCMEPTTDDRWSVTITDQDLHQASIDLSSALHVGVSYARCRHLEQSLRSLRLAYELQRIENSIR
jgi:hypothetical protein